MTENMAAIMAEAYGTLWNGFKHIVPFLNQIILMKKLILAEENSTRKS